MTIQIHEAGIIMTITNIIICIALLYILGKLFSTIKKINKEDETLCTSTEKQDKESQTRKCNNA